MQIPILMYHGISDSSGVRHPINVSIPTFTSHLEYLQSQAYTLLTVSSLISVLFHRKGELPAKPAVVTFDDGLEDFFNGALPILEKFGYPATMYISTSYVGKTCLWFDTKERRNLKMLSWTQIKGIAERGIECGSHGNTHTQLDILPAKKIEEEVRTSKDILEQHVQKKVETFAYPYGLSNPALRQYVKRTGYSSCCAVRHSMVTESSDRFELPRIIISSDLSVAGLQDLLSGRGLRKPYQHERLRTKVNRVFRIAKARIQIKKRIYNGEE